MSLKERIYQHFTDSIQTKHDAVELLAPHIETAAQAIVQSLLNSNKILSCAVLW